MSNLLWKVGKAVGTSVGSMALMVVGLALVKPLVETINGTAEKALDAAEAKEDAKAREEMLEQLKQEEETAVDLEETAADH